MVLHGCWFTVLYSPRINLFYKSRWFKCALNGVNATAIGLVGAACVILWEGAVSTFADAMVFTLALCLCMVYGIGAPYVVITGGIFGAILHKDALGLGQNLWCELGDNL